jgi:hypothetical protein
MAKESTGHKNSLKISTRNYNSNTRFKRTARKLLNKDENKKKGQ